MTVRTPNYTPKTSLTLSAVPGLLPEDAQAAAVIERELEAIDQGEGSVDRLIAYVWPFDDRADRIREYQARIDAHRARVYSCEPDALTESELRLLDGNR